MTAFCSHQHPLRDPAGVSRSPIAFSLRQPMKRLRGLVRRAIRRIHAAFKIIGQAIVTAKTRRLEREPKLDTRSGDDWFLEPAAHRSRDPDSDAAKFPQRPMILGDKWDF
jgi:hypothetical protein